MINEIGSKTTDDAINFTPSGGNASDLSLAKAITDGDISLDQLPWDDEPLLLVREMPPGGDYPLNAFPDIFRDAGLKMHEVIGADKALCGQSILAASSLVTQGHFDITLDGRKRPISTFSLSVAQSGDRKSEVDNVATKPIYEWQQEQKRIYRSEYADYQNDLSIYKASKQKILNGTTADKKLLIDALGEAPAEPLDPQYIFDDTTPEGLILKLHSNIPSVGIFMDEGGKFFGGFSMKDDNRIKTAGILNNFWDGKPVAKNTSHKGNSLLYGRRLAMHIMMQPEIALKILNDQSLNDQGFFARYLIAFPAQRPAKNYNPTNLAHERCINAYYNKLTDLLKKAFPISDDGQLTPRSLLLRPDAKTLWEAYHNETERWRQKKEQYGCIAPLAAKAAEHVLRVASIFSAVNSPGEGEISCDYIASAIDVVNFHLNETERIRGLSSVNRELQDASELLSWLYKKELFIFTTKKVYQNGPTNIRSSATVRKLLTIFLEHRWIRPVSGKNDTWELRPLAKRSD